MVCLSCTATGERVMLAAEGFGNRHCFLENIADKNIPPDLSQCVFVIEQALSVRALQELVTAAGSESVCFMMYTFKLHVHFYFFTFFSHLICLLLHIFHSRSNHSSIFTFLNMSRLRVFHLYLPNKRKKQQQ